MATHLKNATDEQLEMDFEEKVQPIIDYIRDNWKWKTFTPKGYNKFRKSDEYINLTNGNDRFDIAAELHKYDGLDNSNSMGGGLIKGINRYTVAYQHEDQCRDPLTSMVHSLISWGIDYYIEYSKRFGEDRHKKAEVIKCRG